MHVAMCMGVPFMHYSIQDAGSKEEATPTRRLVLLIKEYIASFRDGFPNKSVCAPGFGDENRRRFLNPVCLQNRGSDSWVLCSSRRGRRSKAGSNKQYGDQKAGTTCRLLHMGDPMDPDLLRLAGLVLNRLYQAPNMCIHFSKEIK